MERTIRAIIVFNFGWFMVGTAQNADFWNRQASQTLEKAINLQNLNENVAKNIIIFIGDGMGIPTVTAARILQGQKIGKSGEEHVLSWEMFPHVGLSKTYNIDSQTPDSAGTATAYLCGTKTNRGVIGQDGRAKRSNCLSSYGSDVDSILKLAKDAGKSVGIVTTTRLTHATPSALYAHVPERNWECDADIPDEESGLGCKDIALQFVENIDIDVALAGGRGKFLGDNMRDPEHDLLPGQRKDRRNLIKEWIDSKPPESTTHYVWNQADFDEINPEETDHLLGLFDYGSMNYESFRFNDTAGEPSIAEMTEKAIRILKKNDKGFFLLVEGNTYGRSRKNLLKFNHHFMKLFLLFSPSLSLLIIYIFDCKVDGAVGLDGLPYTTLSYANGPGGIVTLAGFTIFGRRLDPGNITESKIYIQQALVPRFTGSHGGEDVSIYAEGPMAHLLHGVHEQNYIMHVMKYAACLGDNTNHCNERDVRTFNKYAGPTGRSASKRPSLFVVIFLFIFVCHFQDVH
ncbi:alkaline phosphatase-like [Anneissia japonica]|uniref:alkaline phosphatase-like n=1 Tax=Anneissia japonica TaxID=1529436 RepID=UPI0014257DB1|nr:alkaline phosphatase-like [Anneissia japonica]